VDSSRFTESIEGGLNQQAPQMPATRFVFNRQSEQRTDDQQKTKDGNRDADWRCNNRDGYRNARRHQGDTDHRTEKAADEPKHEGEHAPDRIERPKQNRYIAVRVTHC